MLPLNVQWVGYLGQMDDRKKTFTDRTTGQKRDYRKVTCAIVEDKPAKDFPQMGYLTIPDDDDLVRRIMALSGQKVSVEVSAPENDNGAPRGRVVDVVAFLK